MRVLVAAMLVLIAPLLARAETTPSPDALAEALSVREVVAIMREEGLEYGRQIEKDMFTAPAGPRWEATVADIYAVDRVYPAFRKTFDASLAASHADISAMLRYFSSPEGKKTVALELSARRALLDEAVKDAAKLKVQELRTTDDPRLGLEAEFIEANDLVEANVSSALNASLAFYKGLAEGGAMPPGMPESELLGNVWSQEDDTRAETTEWLFSFLVMAHAPLTDAEMRDYIAFSRSQAGRDLNRAMFDGFDAVFLDISHRLGVAAATHVAGQDL
jgi:hypothetical protein